MAATIRTERLLMRLHTADDLPGVLAVWGDPEVVRGLGGRVSTREDCWARILRYAGHWALTGYGFWAVIDAATGRYVGDIGFADFHRDCVPPLGPEPEGGWALASWAHGRGYATEAVRAALAWDGARMGRQLTRCMIDVDNAASVRVAAKCGYALVGEAVYKDTPVRVYERPADPV
jgi:RimJ/RimL family protein N-acetyltransferase